MIEIEEGLFIHEDEIEMDFIRSSGPGGRHVNKVSTAVQLRFDVDGCSTLMEEVKDRLRKIARNRVSMEGVLIIEAKRYRSQDRNRRDALERLKKLILRASKKPKKRKRTKPGRAADERRLKEKREQSEKKKFRKPVRPPED